MSIRIDNVDVYGFEAAIRGMRSPKNSWDKSDSWWSSPYENGTDKPLYIIGKDDMKLMQTLVKAGTDHGKFMRMIGISMDITCNQVWWAEFDTYKIATVRNSCSKMHTIHIKSFVPDDFSHEGIDEVGASTKELFLTVLKELEYLRVMFNTTKEKKYWRAIIELLPSGYNLRATVTLNYAVARAQYHARRYHKMFEWHDYCHMLEGLPYSELITMEGK
nr:MAG TPA: hypothetical protein [Caudoviricetes sp.]